MSKSIAEQIVAHESKEELQRAYEFLIAHAKTEPESLSMVHGLIYEMTCEVPPADLTYYRPISSTFHALDTFIFDGNNNKCYGLVMTASTDIGIKAVAFKQWRKRVGIPENKFCLVFVTPGRVEPSFMKQLF